MHSHMHFGGMKSENDFENWKITSLLLILSQWSYCVCVCVCANLIHIFKEAQNL